MNKLISYCTTSCNRLWQIALTLPNNLRRLEDNEELILLNYGSTDNLKRYIESSTLCQKFIKNKKLIYAEVLGIEKYHSSKAKNIAHRLGSGKFLVNLDADNTNLDMKEKIIKHKNKKCLIYFAVEQAWDTYGRIAIEKNSFYEIGGYDESFMPMGFQDVDLVLRSHYYGIEYISEPLFTNNVSNSREEKMINTGISDWEDCDKKNREISRNNIKNKNYIVNKDGWGRANLILNFNQKIELNPILPNNKNINNL